MGVDIHATGRLMYVSPRALCQPTLWPAPITASLVELQAAGKSYSEMALALGLTRNAVAGKCQRLGLEAVPVSADVHLSRSRAHRPVAQQPAPIVSLNVSLLDRSRFQCSYMTGKQLCCGLPIERGSYCAGHAKIVYQTTRKAA